MAISRFAKHGSGVALLSALILLSGAGRAEPSVQDVTLAETLFRDAKRLMQEQRYAEACAKFAESQKLDPAGGTLLNLAVCYDQDGLTASAWATYSEALAQAKRENREDRVATIQERLTALEARLSRLTVEVSTPREGLIVELDGSPVRRPAWNVAMPVNPGRHRLRAVAPGHDEFTTEVEVPREKSELAVRVPALVRSSATPTAPDPSTRTPAASTPEALEQEPGRSKRATGLVVGGVGLALVGVGGYFGVKALQQIAESDEHCPDDRCDATGAELSEDASVSANVANITIGAGLLAIGAGAYLFVTGTRESAAHAQRGPILVPIVSSHSGGLVFRTSL